MALTQHYVDPAINANSGTGTIGDPYGDLQYALNTATRDATNGNQFNIKAGTSEALAAALSLTTYGTPSADAPLVFRGYTSAAGDGGIGVISGGGSYAVIGSTSYVYFIDLQLTNSGANPVVTFNTGCLAFRCEIDTNTGTNNLVSALAGANNAVVGCYLHGSTYPCISIGASGQALYNYCVMTTSSEAISGNGTGVVIHGNVILLTTSTTAKGILVPYGWAIISNNSIYCSSASTNYGISVSNSSGRVGQLVFNNIVVGISGTGGVGIKGATQHLGITGGNAFYNCTANYSLADGVIVDLSAMDVALGANPFTDAPNGDFSLTTAGKAALRGLGWPAAYKGAHANTDAHITIGAVQYGEAEGGGTCDYPAVADVQSGVTFDSGTKTGTFVAPAVGDVEAGVTYGAAAEFTGTFVVPDVGDVALAVGYGASGTEFTGTLAGGAADWTADEKKQIRQALGVTGLTAATTGTGTLEAAFAALATDDDIKTKLEENGGKLDHLWEMTVDDAGVRQLTAHALELAPAGGGTGLTAQETADAVNNLAPTGASGAAGSIRAQLVNTAKTGADSDTLKTLSDQIDGVQAGSGLTAQETANAVHNLAPVGVAAVGSIGANLDSILNGLTGVGLIPLVYTVTEPGGVIPISGVTVELYTEEACLNCVRRGLTNSFGVVTFWMSTAGTYWIKSAKDRYSFELDSETVAV